jgi:hypothetical protein
MQEFSAGPVRPTSLDDRRRRPRRAHHDEHRVTVLDGLLAGQHFDCVVREVTPETSSVLVRADLRIGQRVKVQPMNEGHPTGVSIDAEVMRSRQLTTGRYEVVIEHRRPAAAPKPSESQRRHERRQARLARMQPVVTRDVNDLLPMREVADQLS